MLNNILNLDGVTVLDKKQQKKVNGGMMGVCRLTTITNGNSETSYIFGLSDSGDSQEAQGQNACGTLLSAGADRCFYNCSHDGMHQ